MTGHQALTVLVSQVDKVLRAHVVLREPLDWRVLLTTLEALARREEQEILDKREESEPPDLLGAQEILGLSDPQVPLGRLEAQA